VSLRFPALRNSGDVDWRRVQRNVRGMQVRIAKACREGKWRKVKSLQRMLTRSKSARYLAVRRVTENQGSRTAGVDKQLWDTPNAKWNAVGQLKTRGYKARHYGESTSEVGWTGTPLGIPTMTDRAMQALYMLALSPIAEMAIRIATASGSNVVRRMRWRSCSCVYQTGFRLLGFGRRHRRVLRQHQPRMAVRNAPTDTRCFGNG
jgi:hypothetical protein